MELHPGAPVDAQSVATIENIHELAALMWGDLVFLQ